MQTYIDSLPVTSRVNCRLGLIGFFVLVIVDTPTGTFLIRIYAVLWFTSGVFNLYRSKGQTTSQNRDSQY